MGRESIQQCIDTLIRETIDGARRWHSLKHVDYENLVQQNLGLANLLVENEWHYIRYEDSYELPFMQGFFYLIHEWSESGRDGTTFDGYNLYVQPTTQSKVTLLLCDTPELYRLKNAIHDKNALPHDVEEFIRAFLEA